MLSIEACSVPENSLLSTYGGQAGTYTDCYSVEIDGSVVLPDFVFAFYTTPIFRLERLVLRYCASKPSTDYQARQLADGSRDTLAAWSVEHRTATELLMCDFAGRTRSWFMVTPIGTSGQARTLLQFGSAVVPITNRRTGRVELGTGFRALLGLHKLYSKVLLSSARLRLETQRDSVRTPAQSK